MKKHASFLLVAALILCASSNLSAQNRKSKTETSSPSAIEASAQTAAVTTVPVIVNGEAQKIPAFENASDWIREDLWVETEFDSDGDGIGDLKGLTEKLDYIEGLGCNEIWMMPIMPSPSYHKYDITDYMNIDKQYGTLDDFDALITECHKRNINVIIDFVINHTSNEHPWF